MGNFRSKLSLSVKVSFINLHELSKKAISALFVVTGILISQQEKNVGEGKSIILTCKHEMKEGDSRTVGGKYTQKVGKMTHKYRH